MNTSEGASASLPWGGIEGDGSRERASWIWWEVRETIYLA